MATKFGRNWQNDLHLAGWRLEMDWNMAQIFNGNILPTFCANLMKIGPEAAKITKCKCKCKFLEDTAKIGISHRISRKILG